MTAAGAFRRLAGFTLLALCLLSGDAAPATETGFRPVDIHVTTIDNFAMGSAETRFGALEFRGGIAIDASDADFGALSGLDFMPDGALLAVADTGFWFSANPVEADGRLIGLSTARLAPMLGADGNPVASKRLGDAEGLRLVERDGRLEAFVSFEQRNDLRRFVAAPDFGGARPQPVPLPKSVGGLSRNGGLEALAIAPVQSPFAGAIVLIAEHSLDKNGNHRGWILGGPRAGAFSLVRSDDFDVTDAAFLPGGDLLVLERRFNFTVGAGMRIRRIAAADLLPGRTVDGRILVEADMRFQIDNMEGMALRPGAGGETLITLCSDDNHSMVQRTILLRFALPAEAPPVPRSRPVVN